MTIDDHSRPSPCESIARVAASAIAEKWLAETYGIEIVAFAISVGNSKLFESIGCLSLRFRPPPSLRVSLPRPRQRFPHRPIFISRRRCRRPARTAELRDAYDSIGRAVTYISVMPASVWVRLPLPTPYCPSPLRVSRLD
ncbi:unnamed protein product, partial [Clonostachys solani]